MSAQGHLARPLGRHLFGQDVAGYQAGRLGYPAALFDRLRNRTAFSILEIGAGTGLATVDLLGLGPDRLTVVEPDPALADHLRRRFVQPMVEIRQDGFLEARLDRQYDLIAAASCFHWLEPEPGLARVRSLLCPGGRFALWWNVYRQPRCGDAFADAVVGLLRDLDLPPSEGADGHYALDANLHRRHMASIGLTMVEQHIFRRERELDAEEIRALYSSYSFVRALTPARRDALLDAIDQLVRTRFGGRAPNVVLTPFYLGERPVESLAISADASAALSGK
jgi:SAM-dependent methyltransferase